MEYQEAKQELIQAWGLFSNSWGINKTMAQIFALLIITEEKITVEEIMEELSISRGNVSMNLRQLTDWGLVKKSTRQGDRKEYFHSDGDVWELTRKIAEQRRKKEIQPLIDTLQNVSDVQGSNKESKQFRKVTTEWLKILKLADNGLQRLSRSDSTWFFKMMSLVLKSKK